MTSRNRCPDTLEKNTSGCRLWLYYVIILRLGNTKSSSSSNIVTKESTWLLRHSCNGEPEQGLRCLSLFANKAIIYLYISTSSPPLGDYVQVRFSAVLVEEMLLKIKSSHKLC